MGTTRSMSASRHQSRAKQRLRRKLIVALPSYSFDDEYPVLHLRPYQRNVDEFPAWSISARRRSDGKLINVYSHYTITETLQYGFVLMKPDPEGDVQAIERYE